MLTLGQYLCIANITVGVVWISVVLILVLVTQRKLHLLCCFSCMLAQGVECYFVDNELVSWVVGMLDP